jgi:hypothetical protein
VAGGLEGGGMGTGGWLNPKTEVERSAGFQSGLTSVFGLKSRVFGLIPAFANSGIGETSEPPKAAVAAKIRLVGRKTPRNRLKPAPKPSPNDLWASTSGPVGPTSGSSVPRGGRLVPTGVALAPTGVALAPTGVALAPTGVALAPTGVALAPTGSALAPTGVALAPTGSALAPTGSALGPTRFPRGLLFQTGRGNSRSVVLRILPVALRGRAGRITTLRGTL